MPLPFAIPALSVPFLVSVGAAGLIGGGAAQPRRAAATGCAIGCGLVAAFVALTGGLPFSQSAPHHAVASIAATITGIALLLAVLRPSVRMLKIVIVTAGMLAIIGCFGFDAFDIGPTNFAMLLMLGLIVMIRLARLIDAGIETMGMISIAAAGLSGIAISGHDRLQWSLAVAFVMACLGWLIASRRQPRAVDASLAILVGGTIVVALSADMVHDALNPPWPMLLLPSCLWGETMASRLGFGWLLKRKKTRLLAVGLGAAAPACVAVGFAVALAVAGTHGAS